MKYIYSLIKRKVKRRDLEKGWLSFLNQSGTPLSGSPSNQTIENTSNTKPIENTLITKHPRANCQPVKHTNEPPWISQGNANAVKLLPCFKVRQLKVLFVTHATLWLQKNYKSMSGLQLTNMPFLPFVQRRFVGKIFSLWGEAYQATNKTLHIKHSNNLFSSRNYWSLLVFEFLHQGKLWVFCKEYKNLGSMEWG